MRDSAISRILYSVFSIYAQQKTPPGKPVWRNGSGDRQLARPGLAPGALGMFWSAPGGPQPESQHSLVESC